MFQEVGDAGDSRLLIYAPDPVLDHEGHGGGPGPGEDEKAEPVVQSVLVDQREGKRRLLCTRTGGESEENEKKDSSQGISGWQ